MANGKRIAVAPLEYRTGGRARMSTDEKWIASGQQLVRQLCDLLDRDGGEIGPATRLIDIGCGPGRLLTGLRSLDVAYAEYVGVDVQQRFIDWLRENMGDEHTTFHRVDMRNARYNPDGRQLRDLSLPVSTAHFDVAVLYSVFTHMLIDDIELYLSVLKRYLAPGGRAFVTAYVQDGVPLETENPIDWPSEHKGRLHRVVLEKSAFEQRVHQAGLEIREFQAMGERCQQYSVGQPTYLLARPETGVRTAS